MEWKRGRWVLKLPIVRDIKACQHEEECKFVELEEQYEPRKKIKGKRMYQSKSQNRMDISGDKFRAKDVSQDTANTMDKRQITNINISLPSRRSSQEEKWEDEAERGNH